MRAFIGWACWLVLAHLLPSVSVCLVSCALLGGGGLHPAACDNYSMMRLLLTQNVQNRAVSYTL
jgi:hypothetical protein